MDVVAGPLGKPPSDRRRLVGAVVVEDEMHVEVVRDGFVDAVEKPTEFGRPVLAIALADDPAALHVERREERRGPVPDVVVGPALRLAGSHRQERLRPVERLDDLDRLLAEEKAKRQTAYDDEVKRLDDLLAAMTKAFERARAAEVVAIKVGVAYNRSLRFEKVAKADAERVFNQLSRYRVLFGVDVQRPPLSWSEAQPLQDYLLHQSFV